MAASFFGLAAIIGAFLAGMVLAESDQRHALEKQIQPIMAFLVPFFFVVTGALGSLSALGTLAVVVLLAVVSKLVGCGLGALSLGRKSALIVGVGMIPRGEVGIIVASLGKQAGIFTETTYAIIIAMSLLTSVIAPPVLKVLLAGSSKEELPDASTLFKGTLAVMRMRGLLFFAVLWATLGWASPASASPRSDGAARLGAHAPLAVAAPERRAAPGIAPLPRRGPSISSLPLAGSGDTPGLAGATFRCEWEPASSSQNVPLPAPRALRSRPGAAPASPRAPPAFLD